MKTRTFAIRIGSDGEPVVREGLEAISVRVAGLVELDPGGMIVLSTDVNATLGDRFISKAKGWLKSWWQKLTRSRKIDEDLEELAEEKGVETGWSIGNFYDGHYVSDEGEVFDEESFAVDIRGVPFEFIEEAGEELRREFDQESVLLINNENGRTFIKD